MRKIFDLASSLLAASSIFLFVIGLLTVPKSSEADQYVTNTNCRGDYCDPSVDVNPPNCKNLDNQCNPCPCITFTGNNPETGDFEEWCGCGYLTAPPG